MVTLINHRGCQVITPIILILASKNLGEIINQDLLLTQKTDLKDIIFHLRNIAKIRKVLPLQDAEKTNPCFYYVETRLLQCSSVRM